jgi:hypothetical protein
MATPHFRNLSPDFYAECTGSNRRMALRATARNAKPVRRSPPLAFGTVVILAVAAGFALVHALGMLS